MADFNRKKLQVFISSTFSDLKTERQAAVEAILNAGHIPAGMELFTAGDESQMQVIKQWIDESDVYLLILGARYGSIELKTGKSYTHLEYEYALETRKPLFACVMKEEITDARVAAQGKEILELENPEKFKIFRSLVLSKISEFWVDYKDIKITIARKMALLSSRENLHGWIRSDSVSNMAALTDEMTRLSRENAQLRELIASKGNEPLFNGLSFTETEALLKKENVYDFLMSNRAHLSRGMQTGTEVMKLVELGLVEHAINGWHRSTSVGKAFLNKTDVFKLGNNQA